MDSEHRIVSSEAEELILVDDDDRETGFLSKGACHDGAGVQHRAFSLFLFNSAGELLLQRRSASKRLWPEFWSNSICSHPRRGETMQVATKRRLLDELNVETELEYVYKFSYRADFGSSGSEHELCHVYLGRIDGTVTPNENEISAIRFLSAEAVDHELRSSPDDFTPWLKLEWQALRNEHAAVLANYCRS